MSEEIWLMPSYFPDFKCKCSACRHCCCHGWNIPISREEYFKLITMECDENLHNRIDHSFIEPQEVTDERFRIISFNYLGDCPLQKDGLCSLQMQQGEQALPSVCRLYPRSLKKINDLNFACCSSSCERVVELLMDDGPLKLLSRPLNRQPQLCYEVQQDYIDELDRFNELLQDNSTTLKERLSKICCMVNEEQFKNDYNCEINPLSQALTLLNRLAVPNSFLEEINQVVLKRYENNYYQYEEDCRCFEERFKNWQQVFENVLNNSIIFENFPFVDKRFNRVNAYKGLCASYGLLRVVSIGYTALHYKKEDWVDAIAALFHLIDHTSFYYNVNILIDSAAIMLKL